MHFILRASVDRFKPENFAAWISEVSASYPQIAPTQMRLWPDRWRRLDLEQVRSAHGAVDVRRSKSPHVLFHKMIETGREGGISLEDYSLTLTSAQVVDLFRSTCLRFRPREASASIESEADSRYAREVLRLWSGHIKFLPAPAALPWLFCVGSVWIEHFGGIERVMSCPAYHVERLDQNLVMIQLVEDMRIVVDDWPKFQAARKAAQNHLGDDWFYSEWDGRTDKIGSPIPVEAKKKSPVIFPHQNHKAPPPISSFDEVISNPGRFKIVLFKGSKVLLDQERRELLSLAVTNAKHWMKRFEEAGVVTEHL
jgi:hypothetical protein